MKDDADTGRDETGAAPAAPPQPHPVEARPGEPLFSTLYQDHYHSRHDGLAETRHVFLDGNDLEARLARLESGESLSIGELGFGTGLNFLATWQLWRGVRRKDGVVRFTSVEGHPITAAQARDAHATWAQLGDLSSALCGAWHHLPQGVWLDDQTHLRVIVAEAEAALSRFEPVQNAWFLDGFSPARNPAMWSAELMRAVAEHSAPEASFASYTAAGWVRRNLEQAGFTVTKRKGFGTKRDMITGRLEGCLTDQEGSLT